MRLRLGVLARHLGLRLGRDLESDWEDVCPVGVADVAAAVGASDEPVSGAASAASPDVPVHVVAESPDRDVQERSEAFLDLLSLLSFDHVGIVQRGPDGAGNPLEVRLRGRDVALLVPSEGLGVLLEPAVAVALGRSLIASAEELSASGSQAARGIARARARARLSASVSRASITRSA